MRTWAWACLAALAAAASPAPAIELTVRGADGASAGLELQRLEPDSDELFVSANALALALQLERFWRPEVRKLVLRAGERRIQVTVDTRLVLDGTDDVLLRVPVRYQRGSVWLPLEFVERVLAPALRAGARFDRRALELVLGGRETDVLAVDFDPRPEATEARIRLVRPLRYRVQATSDEIVRVLLFDAKLDPVAVAADQPAPLVRSVRGEQDRKQAALYFEVTSPLGGVQDAAEDDGRTIVLSLLRAEPRPELVPRTQPMPELPPATDSLDVLVLDAGHGGLDAGVQAHGRREKDVTLQLARELRLRLQSALGLRVAMVRDEDVSLTAERRAELANRTHGDLLVSLHCNGWYDPAASGFEILYVGPPPGSGGDATLAAAEPRIADFRPWEWAQTPHAARSQFFAQILQVELGRRLASPNRGARAAEVGFLRGVAMPAVVLEIGFLTNPAEAQAFADARVLDALAEALAAAVERFGVESPRLQGGSP